MSVVRKSSWSPAGAVMLALGGLWGCAPSGPAPEAPPVFNNTTDPTNGGSNYLGSAACGACHPEIAALHSIHGHAHQLNRIEGVAPTYPGEASGGNVPQPPSGFAWEDISYVIGGYLRRALFVDQDGYILETGVTGVNKQWNLTFPDNGAVAGFVAYNATQTQRQPYEYSCFVCHTTGPRPQDPNLPVFQENRKGIAGTWQEAGVRCEACHGPGSRHVGNPHNRDEFTDASARFCGTCHAPGTGEVIQAEGGFIQYREQYAEFRASGGHAGLACVDCHNPHASALNSENGFRQPCTACHPDKDLGFHAGKVYTRGDFVEELDCQSCHLPLAGKSATSFIVGDSAGRVGDVHTHIFRISTEPVGFTAMFTPDGSAVVKDSAGKAAVTVDFVCLRCHNSDNGFPFRLTIRSASEIAIGIHGFK